MPNRVLAIGAHCDDFEFGALGSLLNHKRNGDEFCFVWFTQARGTKSGATMVADYFSAQNVFVGFRDQLLDIVPLVDIMKPIERAVEEFKPDIAYIPFIHDLNLDHERVSRAAQTALRPYKPNSPKEVLMYEIAGTTELGLRPFVCDKQVLINSEQKRILLEKWYPGELINGRAEVKAYERFERWPRI